MFPMINTEFNFKITVLIIIVEFHFIFQSNGIIVKEKMTGSEKNYPNSPKNTLLKYAKK